MIKSYDQLLARAKKDFLVSIGKMKRQTLRAFLKSKRAYPGIYLIFGEAGELLYIGRTRKSIRARIQCHLSPKSSSGLLFYACRERGLATGIQKSHQCVCGRLIGCDQGSHKSPISKEALVASSELAKTCSIATLEAVGAAYSGSQERLLTEVLRPKYGFHVDDEE